MTRVWQPRRVVSAFRSTPVLFSSRPGFKTEITFQASNASRIPARPADSKRRLLFLRRNHSITLSENKSKKAFSIDFCKYEFSVYFDSVPQNLNNRFDSPLISSKQTNPHVDSSTRVFVSCLFEFSIKLIITRAFVDMRNEEI